MFYSDYRSERYGCKPVSDWQGVVSGPLITGRPTNELQVARTCCRANTGPRAPRFLPMGDGRSRATSQSTRDMFHQLSPTISRQRREVQDVRECNAIVRYALRPSLFIPTTVSFSLPLPLSPLSLTLSLSHTHTHYTVRKFQCVHVMLFCRSRCCDPS